MKHKTIYDAYKPGNLYKTEILADGIKNYYCISIGFNKCQLMPEYERTHYSDDLAFEKEVMMVKFINVTRTFKKTPKKASNKRVYSKEYTQSFRFVKIAIFTPYWAINSMTVAVMRDKEHIKKYIEYCSK